MHTTHAAKCLGKDWTCNCRSYIGYIYSGNNVNNVWCPNLVGSYVYVKKLTRGAWPMYRGSQMREPWKWRKTRLSSGWWSSEYLPALEWYVKESAAKSVVRLQETCKPSTYRHSRILKEITKGRARGSRLDWLLYEMHGWKLKLMSAVNTQILSIESWGNTKEVEIVNLLCCLCLFKNSRHGDVLRELWFRDGPTD